jgi:uncharacterized cupredoxin-like copper-binding protein
MRFRRIGASALVVLALGSFVVACGDDDDDTTAAGDQTSETTAATGGDSTSDEAPTITVGATDDVAAKKFTFDIPSDLTGGVFTIELDNKGKELHDFQLVKAEAGKTLQDMLGVLGDESSTPEWIKVGAGVGSTAPGTVQKATVDLAAGKYFYFCTESSGDDANSVAHATNGMSGELTLTGDSGASLPETDGSITASEYRFEAKGLKAGENTFTFENAGTQLHHVLALPIADGKTLEDVKAAFASEQEPTGPPPVDFEKGVGTAVVGPGQSEVATWDLQSGSYALICFMTDYGTTGPPHVAKGMIEELKIG